MMPQSRPLRLFQVALGAGHTTGLARGLLLRGRFNEPLGPTMAPTRVFSECTQFSLLPIVTKTPLP